MSTQNDQSHSHTTGTPPALSSSATRGKLVEYDQFIEAQLRKTRSQVRTIDIAGALMTLAAGGLVFLLGAALVDHWVVRGGLPPWARWTALAIFLVSGVTYLVVSVAPLLLRRINPLYAAEAIERSRPTLKNALVNFLFLRASSAAVPSRVFEAVEEQAATNLARVHVDAAIDRTRLVRTAYVLAGVLLVAALYTVVSPKNLLQTAGRIVMPWAEIDAPTRTTIVDIEPGNVQAFRGQQVAVSARIQNLPTDGKALLVYTTADRQIVDRAVPMVLAGDGYKHAAVLPPGDAALQQDVEYRIEAGDAISRRFKVGVSSAPAIVVRSITYRYPKYTGLIEQRVEQQGDIRAIEGTQVLIEAQANQEIETASLDLDCDASRDRPMVVSGRDAKIEYRLGLKPDGQGLEHSSYQLIFTNAEGQQNPQPVRHQIEVTPDLPPAVQIVGPKQDDLELPADGAIQIEVVANDPDFALRLIKLSATSRDKSILDEVLSSEVQQGQVVRKYQFEPKKLGLKAGDVVDYWAAADDNKEPRANHVESPKRRFRIVSPTGKRAPEQIAQRERPGEGSRQPGANDPGKGDSGGLRDKTDESADKREASNERRADGEKRDEAQPRPADSADNNQPSAEAKSEPAAQQRPGEQGDLQVGGSEGAVPSDGTDDGDAIERILEHRDQQSNDKPKDRSRQDKRDESNEDKSAGKQGQDSSQQQGQQGGGSESKSSGGQQQGGGGEQGGGEQSNSGQSGSSAGKSGAQNQSGSSAQQKGQQAGGKDRQSTTGQGQSPAGGQSSSQGDSQQQGDRNAQQSGDKKSGSSQGKQGSRDKSQQGSDAQAGEENSGVDSAGKPQPTQGQERNGKAGQNQSGQGQQDGGAQGKGQRDQSSSANQPGSQDNQQGQQSKGEKGARPNDAQGSDRGQSDESGTSKAGSQSGKQTGKGSQAGKPSGTGDQSERGEPSPLDKSGSEQSAAPDDQERAPRGEGDDRPRGGGDDQKGVGESQKQSDRDQRRPGDTQDNATPDKSSERGDTEGQGGQSKSDPTAQKQAPRGNDRQKPDAAGGDGEHDKGNSGAGHATEDTKGSPNAKQAAKPTNKSPGATKDKPDKEHEDEGHAASESQRESNTESSEDGEHSGGGKRGGGQQANKPGTGGPGQNTAADEGAGTADEAGKGEVSDRAGQDRQASRPTGQSGADRGKGSDTRPSEGGDKPNGDGRSKELGSQSTGESLPSGEPGEGSESTGPPQGGKPGGSPADQKWQPGTDHADEANLEYARQATELALQHLKDELKKDHPDPALLDRLGWTAGDLENFVKRWEQMRSQARSSGEAGLAARKELDETLRSLGLRPKSTSLKASAARDDQSRGLKESRRTRPPAEYAEQSKAYSQGTARGEK